MCFICSRPIQCTAHLPDRPSFSRLLLYSQSVLTAVFRGTPRATFRVPKHTSLIMASENVILITLNLIYIPRLWFYFRCKSRITKVCFSYTSASNVFLPIKFSKFYFHFCAQKVCFNCASVPRIFGFSRTDSTNIKRVKIRVSDKGKNLLRFFFAYSTSVKLCPRALI